MPASYILPTLPAACGLLFWGIGLTFPLILLFALFSGLPVVPYSPRSLVLYYGAIWPPSGRVGAWSDWVCRGVAGWASAAGHASGI